MLRKPEMSFSTLYGTDDALQRTGYTRSLHCQAGSQFMLALNRARPYGEGLEPESAPKRRLAQRAQLPLLAMSSKYAV